MKNELILAFNELLEEKQLPKDVIMSALEYAMVSAYRKAENASNAQHIEAKIDLQTGRVTIYAEKEIVEKVQDPRTEISLEEALKINPQAKLGGMIVVDSTPKDFGRVAAQTARQVIQQRIREAEREAQLRYFKRQVGEIVSGVVQAITPIGLTLGLEMKAEGIMPRKEMIPGERYRVHERIRALLLEVKDTGKGPQIILSRAHRNFLRRLLENEVPEIYHGMVEIRSIAREPGQRSKVAVAALQAGVDPVGACVGMRGVRIQAIVRELNDEKIDVIEWNPDPAIYIAKALSPARVTGVYLSNRGKGTKTATVVVPEDQLSLAIGRDGQNARLAARLTSWRIDIKSLPEAAIDALNKIQKDPEYAVFAELERDIIPQVEQILNKKAEGRPVTPEEYQLMSQFVDRVERGILRQREGVLRAEEEKQLMAAANIPDEAFEIPLEDIGLPLRYTTLLNGAGYLSVGDLMLQLKLDPNKILALEGIGPKAMAAIEEALANFSLPKEEVVVEEASSQKELFKVDEGVSTEKGDLATVSPAAEEAPFEKEMNEPEVVPGIAEEAERAETLLGEVTVLSQPKEEAGSPAPSTAEESAEELSIDELFRWSPEEIEIDYSLVAEDEDEETEADKRKKKKRKKYVEYEYDPEQSTMIVKKKRKRGGSDWDEDWDL
ncbi:MAG: transcription termination factor NusA [Anaerolineales bacterium]|nr:transcription termination factor NusA [Anaerolineales bacterium]MDW8160609.1 transcription termination factor NusA [Anaerolineales bacterium]